MNRRVLMLALFLILFLVGGAIVNVAVAWGFTNRLYLTPPKQSVEHARDLTPDEKARLMATCDLAHVEDWVEHANVYDRQQRGMENLWLIGNHGNMLVPADFRLAEQRFGWPCIALRKGGRTTMATRTTEYFGAMRIGERRFPIGLVWPGFAINTVFYAAILWLLCAAPFALRRRRRIKRGLCTKCAYPVGMNDVCTECGAAVVDQPRRGVGL